MESVGAKLIACKEYEKWCKKIVDNPMLYLEEHQHQILPEEHQPEIHSLQFFGPGAERAAIEFLAIIDLVAKFVKISCSPVPKIPGFLRRPFIKGKLVKHPIPDDLAESIHKEKCVWTKAQKAWTYLCALLQFWTDQATTESGDVMYGGRHRPVNPMIARIQAMLNLSFGDHFKITWASIAVSTEAQQPMGARHPTEADSVPPGFARIHRKTPEEHEATRYGTPANSKQSIDEELGIQDVTNIMEDWYAQSELASAVKSVLQPMEVDEPPEEPPRISNEEAPNMLGLNPGSGSPVTAAEDRALDTPGGFSRAPGDGRPITGSAAGSSSRRITGRSTEG